MSKRGNGEGSVRQRPDGRWEARVALPPDGAGRVTRYSLYGKTRREVAAKLREAQTRQQDGQPVADNHNTVGAIVARWLSEALPASDLKATTIENYATLARLHIMPALGHHRLDALTPADVQRWINAKRATGLSERTVQLAYAVLRRALGQAVRWGDARRNVATLVDRPRVTRHEAAHLSVEQAQAFLDAARGERLEAFYSVAIAIACGLRRGEALGLRWSDVDLAEGTLRVARTLSRTKAAGLQFTEPKTARSRRTLPLPGACVEQLRRHRKRQAVERLTAGNLWADQDLVFPSKLGTPLDPRNALRACQGVACRAGLGPVKLHTLRHTCASLLLAQDVHPRVVMETLGHSGIAITMDIYSHVMPQQQRQAADVLANALRW